jgi:hypothetical protein
MPPGRAGGRVGRKIGDVAQSKLPSKSAEDGKSFLAAGDGSF